MQLMAATGFYNPFPAVSDVLLQPKWLRPWVKPVSLRFWRFWLSVAGSSVTWTSPLKRSCRKLFLWTGGSVWVWLWNWTGPEAKRARRTTRKVVVLIMILCSDCEAKTWHFLFLPETIVWVWKDSQVLTLWRCLYSSWFDKSSKCLMAVFSCRERRSDAVREEPSVLRNAGRAEGAVWPGDWYQGTHGSEWR